ncbi:MAG TPA: hypothetical protein VHZ25_14670 [Acidobacteriaceae bacterium]|jgi:hypothetical protein|nr:hypothetical protein [Acidobacteriaceae bacterium]
MKCANPACGTESLYLRGGKIYHVDFLVGTGKAGEGQIIQRRVIWLCDACTGLFAVETWRPPGEQVRPSRRPLIGFPRARGRKSSAESWS